MRDRTPYVALFLLRFPKAGKKLSKAYSWFIFLENEDFFAKIFALFALFRLFLREGDIFSRFRGGSFWAGPSHIQFHCVRLCWRKNVTLSFFFLVISFVRRKRWTQEAFYSMCQLIEKQLEPTPVTRLNCQCPHRSKRRWTISNQTTEGSENELSFFSPSCQSNLLTLIPS